MARGPKTKTFPDATVMVHRPGAGRPDGSRIESRLGVFTVPHWPQRIRNVTEDKALGALVVETNSGRKLFLGPQEALTESSAGGSMGGHDPRAQGKIRYIVRAFGKWAGGKHSICVRRIRSEHPEVAKGKNVNALCAWLKDQWAGTTKWRGKSSAVTEGAAVQQALLTASARFQRGLPVVLTEGELDALVDDVQALTGISPMDVLMEVTGSAEALVVEDIFEAIFEEDAAASSAAIATVGVELAEAVRHGGPVDHLVGCWLALHGDSAPVDEDPQSILEAARRIVGAVGAASDPGSHLDERIMEAQALPEVQDASDDEDPVSEVNDLTRGLVEAATDLQDEDDLADPPPPDLVEASHAQLVERAVRLGEDLEEPVRRSELLGLGRNALVARVRVLEGRMKTGLCGHRYSAKKKACPKCAHDFKESNARDEAAGALVEVIEAGKVVQVSGYVTRSGKKVRSHYRGKDASGKAVRSRPGEGLSAFKSRISGKAPSAAAQKSISGPSPKPKDNRPLRGPTGKLRNFRAMSDEKLADAHQAIKGQEHKDREGHAALVAEMKGRGFKVGAAHGGVPTRARAQKSSGPSAKAPAKPSATPPTTKAQAQKALDALYDKGTSVGRQHQIIKSLHAMTNADLQSHFDKADLTDLHNAALDVGRTGMSNRIAKILDAKGAVTDSRKAKKAAAKKAPAKPAAKPAAKAAGGKTPAVKVASKPGAVKSAKGKGYSPIMPDGKPHNWVTKPTKKEADAYSAKAHADEAHRQTPEYKADQEASALSRRLSRSMGSLPTAAEIRKLSPAAQEKFLRSAASSAQSAVWRDNREFRRMDAYIKRLKKAGFHLPAVDNTPPRGFQDSAHAADPTGNLQERDMDQDLIDFAADFLERLPPTVRTHVRTLPDGRVVAVRPHERGVPGRTRSEMRTRSEAVSRGNRTRAERRREPGQDGETEQPSTEQPVEEALLIVADALDLLAESTDAELVELRGLSVEDVVALATASDDDLAEAGPSRRYSSYSAGRGPNARGEVTVRRFKSGAYVKYDVSGKKPRIIGRGKGNRTRAKLYSRARTAQALLGNRRLSNRRSSASVIRSFQKSHGLKVDGIVGPKTRAKMRAVHARRRR